MPVSRLIPSVPYLAPLALAALIGASACSDPDTCALVDTECQPLYQPTFDNIFQNTLLPSCGVAGVACHAPEGNAGGLVLADAEASYQAITGDNPRIDLDNVGCGPLLSRISSSDPSYQMPPSAPLAEAELCAIRQWVVAGAPR